jgi:DNA invertase Pin-like site-specific DNA recombinase
MTEKEITRVAYSYIRFSSKKQEENDSVRRQTELTRAYCERRGLTLFKTTFRDLGLSAFRGKNALLGNLGLFLKLVGQGSVQPGSILIVESLDRITRQGVEEGLDLIKRILKAGINIVTLLPEREFDARSVKSLADGLLEIQFHLERAAAESELKSQRVAAKWREKQRCARAGAFQPPSERLGRASRCLTRRLPSWLMVVDGTIVAIEERAKVVRQIFQWSAGGYGTCQIVAKLTAAGIPAFGGKDWLTQYIGKIIRDKRARGEYQPRTAGKADGPAVPGYFPAVVTDKLWLKANAQLVSRTRRRSQPGKYVNLFSGLLHNARQAGDTYLAATNRGNRGFGNSEGTLHRVLVSTGGTQGRGGRLSFPLDVFERALLSVLAEVDVQELFPPEGPPAALESERLEAELQATRDFKQAVEDEMVKRRDRGKVADDFELRDRLAAEITDLDQRLTLARIREVHPPAESWKEAKTLLAALDRAKDKVTARTRLKAALRRVVKGIWLLVVPRGRTRLCEVLLTFEDAAASAYRAATIVYQATKNNRWGRRQPARWAVVSFAQPKGSRPGWPAPSDVQYLGECADGEAFGTAAHGFEALDLRDQSQADAAREFLEAYPADLLAKWLAEFGQTI